MEIDKKINRTIIEFQQKKKDKKSTMSSLDKLLKTDVPLLEKGKKRFIKNKIHNIKKVL